MQAITDDALIENLRDAGCTPDAIEQITKCYKKDHTSAELRRILSKQRRLLLEKVHESQRQLDCLDYLLYKIKKGEAEI